MPPPEQFVQFYYKTFDENRPALGALYKDHSMLTFENSPVQGAAGITEKLVALPFEKVQHEVASLDAQPSNEAGGILVLVAGRLLLLPDGAGSYYVFNDIFRLVYAAA
ncbi:unnamed protein product [Aureobasidium pullulans]|nr:unnamed protein product [Aureobasidium pullulans]